MPKYSITFARSARRELESLSNILIARILPKIEAPASDPRPHGCRKLRGSQELWRIRVDDYRVIYSIQEKQITVDVIGVCHRSEAYD